MAFEKSNSELSPQFTEKLTFIDMNIPGDSYAVGGTVIKYINGENLDDDVDLDIVNEGIDPRPILDAGFVNSQVFRLRGTVGELYTHKGHNIDCFFTLAQSDEDAELKGIKFLEKDATHRDFTVCSVYMNCKTKEIYDPTGTGLSDIATKTLRMNDAIAKFKEDPTRFLRLAKYMVNEYKPDENLQHILQTFKFDELEIDVDHLYHVIKKHLEQIKLNTQKKCLHQADKFHSHFKKLTNRYVQILHEYGILERFFNIQYTDETSWEYIVYTLMNFGSSSKNSKQVSSPTMPRSPRTLRAQQSLFASNNNKNSNNNVEATLEGTKNNTVKIEEINSGQDTTPPVETAVAAQVEPRKISASNTTPNFCLLPKEILQHFEIKEKTPDVQNHFDTMNIAQNTQEPITPIAITLQENTVYDVANNAEDNLNKVNIESKTAKYPNRKKYLTKQERKLVKENDKNNKIQPILDTNNNNNDIPQNKNIISNALVENTIQRDEQNSETDSNNASNLVSSTTLKKKKKDKKSKQQKIKLKTASSDLDQINKVKAESKLDLYMRKFNEMTKNAPNDNVVLFNVSCTGDYKYMLLLCGANNTTNERKEGKVWNEAVNSLANDLLAWKDEKNKAKLLKLKALMTLTSETTNAFNDMVKILELINKTVVHRPIISANTEYTVFPLLANNDIHILMKLLEKNAFFYTAKLNSFLLNDAASISDFQTRFDKINVHIELATDKDLNQSNQEPSLDCNSLAMNLFIKFFVEPENNFERHYKELAQFVNSIRTKEKNNNGITVSNSNTPTLFNNQNQTPTIQNRTNNSNITNNY